jgi:hypothetical protein
MPGRATGNARESRVADELDKLGYAVVSIKGSGARGAKMRRRLNPVIGDLLALGQWGDPFLQIECGAHTARAAFKALRTFPLTGFTPLAVLYVYRLTKGKERAKKPTVRWYATEYDWFPTAQEAIAFIRQTK